MFQTGEAVFEVFDMEVPQMFYAHASIVKSTLRLPDGVFGLVKHPRV